MLCGDEVAKNKRNGEETARLHYFLLKMLYDTKNQELVSMCVASWLAIANLTFGMHKCLLLLIIVCFLLHHLTFLYSIADCVVGIVFINLQQFPLSLNKRLCKDGVYCCASLPSLYPKYHSLINQVSYRFRDHFLLVRSIHLRYRISKMH